MRRILLFVALAAISQTLVFCQKQTVVEIETVYGNMEFILYDDTPQHRDNFIKLADEGFYDGSLFHRVINEFMIQGGDPNSKGASSDAFLGDGGPGYQLEAEILYPKHFHKRGALSAARQGDQVNPLKKSSGSQFYIVQGKVFTVEELDQMELMSSERKRQQIMMKYANPYRNELIGMQQANDREGFEALMAEIMKMAAPEIDSLKPMHIPEEQRAVYTTLGGVPHLDGDYTVFGELISGMDVLDKIAGAETNEMDRPLEDIVIKVKVKKK